MPKDFAGSAEPPQLVANLHEIDIGDISVDVIRCRYRALTENAEDILVFCPADAPVPRRTVESTLDTAILRTSLERQGNCGFSSGRRDRQME